MIRTEIRREMLPHEGVTSAERPTPVQPNPVSKECPHEYDASSSAASTSAFHQRRRTVDGSETPLLFAKPATSSPSTSGEDVEHFRDGPRSNGENLRGGTGSSGSDGYPLSLANSERLYSASGHLFPLSGRQMDTSSENFPSRNSSPGIRSSNDRHHRGPRLRGIGPFQRTGWQVSAAPEDSEQAAALDGPSERELSPWSRTQSQDMPPSTSFNQSSSPTHSAHGAMDPNGSSCQQTNRSHLLPNAPSRFLQPHSAIRSGARFHRDRRWSFDGSAQATSHLQGGYQNKQCSTHDAVQQKSVFAWAAQKRVDQRSSPDISTSNTLCTKDVHAQALANLSLTSNTRASLLTHQAKA